MARGPVGKYKCLKCSKDISLIAKTRHDRSCDGVFRHYKTEHNKSKDCVFCGRSFSNAAGCGVHMTSCDKNPTATKKTRPDGWVNWNKGKTKLSDTRIAKAAEKKKETSRLREPAGCCAWDKETRSRAAKEQGLGGYRENAGRSKKFRVVDSYGNPTTLQSSYELKCSELLNELGIQWTRPKALKYDGRNYFADFYLPEYDIWLDPKNSHKAKQDEEKIRKVIEQNGVRLFVLLNEQLTTEYIRELVMAGEHIEHAID